MRLKNAAKSRYLWRRAAQGTPRREFESLAHEIAVLNSSYANRTFWRGVASADFLIWPSAYRTEDWPHRQLDVDERVDSDVDDLEKKFAKASVHWPVSYSPRFAVNQRDQLAVMQHQGIPTRLVDLTADPYVALWFACEDHTRECLQNRDSGVLLAFNFPLRAAETVHSEPNAASGFSWFRPPAIDSRIVAQRSIFLQSRLIARSNNWPSDLGRVYLPNLPAGWSESSLTRLFDSRSQGRPELIPPILAFEVRAGSKDLIRGILDRNFGLTQDSLFPDLGGIN